MSIKRYEPVEDGIHPYNTGDYVLYTDHIAALEANQQVIETLRAVEAEALFLVDRLEDYEVGSVDHERDFYGHVSPSVARLRRLLDALTTQPEPTRGQSDEM